MNDVTIIRVVAGLLAVSILIGLLIGVILYILSLSRTLNKCSAASRTMQPGMVWLLLIPLFNLIWHFFVVLAMAKSLGNEFRAKNIQNNEPEPGKAIGIAMCVCGACTIIPVLNLLTGLAQLVLWAIYWSKIVGYSRLLDQFSASPVA